jgi:hypothetical protein
MKRLILITIFLGAAGLVLVKAKKKSPALENIKSSMNMVEESKNISHQTIGINEENPEELKKESADVFYKQIEKKVYLSPKELDQNHYYLSNKEEIYRQLNVLLKDNHSQYDRESELVRFKTLKYFISAVEWKENPGKTFIKEALLEYVEKRTIHEQLDVLKRK